MATDTEKLDSIFAKAIGGERISDEEALLLLKDADLNDLGSAATEVKERLHPERIATFTIDRNINYTNTCVADCSFCAFYRRPGDPEEYTLTREQLHQKIQELVDIGGTQLLMQGGHNPYLKLEWYEEMLSDLRKHFPNVQRHCFSPSEIIFFSKLYKKPVAEILSRLKEAGLQSIPGGGGEILVDRVRKIIAPKKAMTDDWLLVYQDASKLGIQGSVSMVIGHYETLEERIEHLRRIREVQDQTGGLKNGVWKAFIVWTMQPAHTELEGKIPGAGSAEYLRMAAVARLYLDNIPNIQASWVTQGSKIGQMSFLFGVNDWGGLMMEENVVSQAGTVFHVQIEEMRRLSEQLGLTLRQRNFHYNLIDKEPRPEAAD